MTPFYSVAVVFSKDKKKILLGKRKEDKLWTSPAGGGEEGESPKACIIRELFEESNISCKEKDLKFLTSLTAKNGKPIFIFTTCIDSKQNIHVKNDPDKEVPSWKWFPLDAMPALEENRQKTVNMAKMKMNDLIKSIVSTDMHTGVDLYTQDFSQDDMAARDSNWYNKIIALMDNSEVNEPETIQLENGFEMIIQKIGEGLYSGSIKDGSKDRVLNFAELSIPSLVQTLKAKEFIDKDSKIDEMAEPAGPPEGDSDVKVEASGLETLSDLITSLKHLNIEGDLNITIQKSVTQLMKKLLQKSEPKRGKRGFPIGTQRTWSNGVKAVKHADGWVVLGGQHHGKLIGKFKEEAKEHHLNVANEQHKDNADTEMTNIHGQIKQLKEAHEKKQQQIKAEHDKMMAELSAKHEAAKKRVEESKAKLKQLGAKLGEKGKGSEKKPEDTKEGTGSNQEKEKTGTEGAGKQSEPTGTKEEPKGSDTESAGPVADPSGKDKEPEVDGKTEGSSKKEITPEQQNARDRGSNHFKRVKGYHEEIGSMTKKEYIKAYKESVTTNIKEKYPEASDSIIKDALKRSRVTATAKNKYDAVIAYAPKYGLPMDPVMASETTERSVREARKINKEAATTEEGAKLVESDLNKKTNLIKSIDFSKTSKANRETLNRHLNDSNKIIESMGIQFKTPMYFKCDRLGKGTKRTRATYAPHSRTVNLKDKSAANKSVMHEIGHGLDHALGEGKFRSSEISKMSPELAKDYQELSDLVSSSKYYEQSSKSFQKYLNDPTEVFARGFEVYSLVKAEELQTKGQVSKDFTDDFLPDVFRQTDDKVLEMSKKREALEKQYWKATGKEAKLEVQKELTETASKLRERLTEVGGRYTAVSPEMQKEYKTKISAIMERILASDEIKKALQILELRRLINSFGVRNN